MNQTVRAEFVDSATPLQQIAAPLGLEPAVWGDVLSACLSGLDAALAIKDLSSGRYVHASPKMGEFFACAPDAVRGRTDLELLGVDAAALLRAADATTATVGRSHTTDHRLERDRKRREFKVTRVLLRAADAADSAPAKYLCAIWVEVTQTRQRDAQLALALKQLEQQQVDGEALRRETQDSGLRDAVTGLYQTSHFDDQLRREVDLSSREHREFSLVSISLDPSVGAASALGAPARLRVVEALGRLLRGNTRAMDASCRMTEDRFSVLLSGVGLATAHSRMEGLRRQCATQIVVLDGQDFGFTVSMGVASFPHTAHTQEELTHAAETALAAAQGRGGNHVTLASIRFDGTV